MAFKFLSLAGLAVLSTVGLVTSAAVERRAVLPHDQIVGFPETVPNTNIGQLYLRYKPHLRVVNGCVPFPAVDADGNTRCVHELTRQDCRANN